MKVAISPDLKPRSRAEEIKINEFLRTKAKKITERKLNPIDYKIQGDYYHMNFVDYLSHAYLNHLSVIVSPHDIWYFMISEITTHIKNNSEKYRSLFTESRERITLEVVDPSSLESFVDELVIKMESHNPFLKDNPSAVLPKLSTGTKMSAFATQCSFLEAMEHYYMYLSSMCGFRYIKLEGTQEDWEKVYNTFMTYVEMLDMPANYVEKTKNRLKGFIQCFDGTFSEDEKIDFLKTMYYREDCSSGHTTEVDGWILELYMTQVPNQDFKSIDNHNNHIASVSFKNISDDKNYQIRSGLFGSELKDDGFLYPYYGYVIFEELEKPIDLFKEYELMKKE